MMRGFLASITRRGHTRTGGDAYAAARHRNGAVGQFQSGFTNWCPMMVFLRKLGLAG